MLLLLLIGMSIPLAEYGVTDEQWNLFTRNIKKKIKQAHNQGNMEVFAKFMASGLARVDPHGELPPSLRTLLGMYYILNTIRIT